MARLLKLQFDIIISMSKKAAGDRSIYIKSYLMPVITLVLVIFQLLFPYKGWVILASGFVGMWVLGFVWTYSLRSGLNLEREMRFGWIQVGDHIQERILIENTSRFPAIWVKIIDHSQMPGYTANKVTSVRNQYSTHWFTHGICHRRGIYTLGPTSIESGDPLGFFGVRVNYTETVTMIVVPPVVSLPTIEIAPGGRAGEGKSTSRGFDKTIVAGGVREYMPGDSLRWLHWPTTAKHNKPFVRIFDFSPSSNWWVLLDMDPMVQAGTGQESTEEVGVILAASLVNEGLRKDKRVGFIAQGDELIWHQPGEGDSHLWKVMRSLAVVKPCGPALPTILDHIRTSLEYRTSLIIITPNDKTTWLNNLGLLRRKEIVPTILLLNPEAFGGSKNPDPIQNSLLEMGIRHYNIKDTIQDFSQVGFLDQAQQPGERMREHTGSLKDQKVTWRPLG